MTYNIDIMVTVEVTQEHRDEYGLGDGTRREDADVAVHRARAVLFSTLGDRTEDLTPTSVEHVEGSTYRVTF